MSLHDEFSAGNITEIMTSEAAVCVTVNDRQEAKLHLCLLTRYVSTWTGT